MVYFDLILADRQGNMMALVQLQFIGLCEQFLLKNLAFHKRPPQEGFDMNREFI